MRRKLLTIVLCLSVIAISQAAHAEEGEWDASVAVGLNTTKGNSDTMLATLGVSGQKEEGHNILHLGVDAAYGETTVEQDDGTDLDETTAQNAKAYANYKRTRNRSFAYLDANILHDDIADVDYRAAVGPGVGYFFVKSEESSLSAEAGPTYIWEKVGGVEDDYLAIRIAERGEMKLSDTSKLWESLEYLPKAEDFDDYLLVAEVGAEAALNSSLSLRVVAQDKYDSTPAADQEQNDLSITAAIVYQL